MKYMELRGQFANGDVRWYLYKITCGKAIPISTNGGMLPDVVDEDDLKLAKRDGYTLLDVTQSEAFLRLL